MATAAQQRDPQRASWPPEAEGQLRQALDWMAVNAAERIERKASGWVHLSIFWADGEVQHWKTNEENHHDNGSRTR